MRNPFSNLVEAVMRDVRQSQRPRFPVEEHKRYTSLTYSSIPCGGHYNPRVQEILDYLKEAELDKRYKLHLGKARGSYRTGKFLQDEVEVERDAYKIRSESDGFQMEFEIEPSDGERHQDYGKLHLLFIRRDPERQGGFYEIKKLVGEMKELFLEGLGYQFFWGVAEWSLNSEIREQCSPEKDWRNVHRYVGLDSRLKPIFLSGIKLMWLRLGFIPNPASFNDPLDTTVILLSNERTNQIKLKFGNNFWFELTKFHPSNRKTWNRIVRERETKLGKEELERRKQETLKGVNEGKFYEQDERTHQN